MNSIQHFGAMLLSYIQNFIFIIMHFRFSQLSGLTGVTNIFLLAAIATVILVIGYMAAGLIIRWIADAITALISLFTGGVIAFTIRNYVTFPGTVHHEFSHAIIATITGAKVNSINLLPRGMTLGSVKFTPRGNKIFADMQVTLASAAPVFCGFLTLYLMYNYLLAYCTKSIHYVLFVYFFVSIFFHMTLSSRDLKNIFFALPVSLPVFYICFLGYFFFI